MPSENKTTNIRLNQWQGNENLRRQDLVDDNAIIDAAIGNRTIDDTKIPDANNSTSLSTLLSWLGNMIKSITGKSSWRTAPVKSIEQLNNDIATHSADTAAHSATAAATANKIIARDLNGRAKVAAPSVADDIARKDTVDAVQTNLMTHMGDMIKHVVKDGTLQNGLNAEKIGGVDLSGLVETKYRFDTNMNTITQSGMYRVNSPVNLPSGAAGYGQSIVSRNSDTITQIYSDYVTGNLWTRSGNPPEVGGAGAWTSWKQLINNDSAKNHKHASTLYHPTNGILVECIPESWDVMVTLVIKGNGYFGLKPFFTIIQFYNYITTNTIINAAQLDLGHPLNDVKVFAYNGKIYVWFSQPSMYQTFLIEMYTNADQQNTVTPAVSNSVFPTSGVSKLQAPIILRALLDISGEVSMARDVLKQPQLKDYTEIYTDWGGVAGSASINLSYGNVQRIALNGAVTISFTAIPPSGQAGSLTLKVVQGVTAYAVTWPAGVKWPNDTIPDISTTNKVYDFVFFTVDGGTIWHGALAGKYSS